MPVRLGPSDRPRQPLEVVALAVVSGPAMLWGLRLDDGRWTTPAGHLNPGEDPRAGGVRELWEEAGIRANPSDLRDLGARQSGQYLVHCFRLDLPEQVEATSDHDPDEEVGEWRWAGLEDGKLPSEIAGNLHVPAERNALLQALGLAKRESFAVAPGEHLVGTASALLRPHPAGRDWQVVWSAGGTELGRTGRLSKAEAETAVGEWLEKASILTVGENHTGRLLHGTTKQSARAFATGTDLPDRDRTKTLSEFGDVIYTSDPTAPHQASMFSHGKNRTMVEFQLKPGTKILDFSKEMARLPFFGGDKQRILAFSGRPSHTDDMKEWLSTRRNQRGMPTLTEDQLSAAVDPTHPNFNVSSYASILPSYVRDRGYHGFRFHDETVLTDRNAIKAARELKSTEIKKIQDQPRAGTPRTPGALYSEIEKGEVRLEKAAEDLPPADPAAATPSPTPKKLRAPRAPKTPKSEPEKNLVVQHNISDRGLANAHKLGGLPAPSLAIAHKDSPLTGFGDISLVAHPSMVDPKSKVPLFDSDVYSPRYPRAKRKINERAVRQLEQELKPHLEETNRMGYRSLDAHDVTRDLEREQPEDFAEKRNGATAALGLAYLRSKGEKVELPPEGPPEMEDIPQKYTFTHRMNGLKGIQIPAEGPIDLPIRQRVAAEMHRLIEEDVRKQGAEKGWTPEQIERKIGISKKYSELGEMVDGKFQPWPADDPIDNYMARDVLNDINNIGKQRPRERPSRDRVMADMVHERVRDDPGFKQYLRDKLGPLQGDEYIEVGESGRKVPHTMENVLRVLTGKIRGGEESAFGGLGQVRAAGSKQFRSLDQAKQEGGRLVSKQKMEEAKKENEEHFGRLVSELTPHHTSFKDGKNAFGRYDNAAGVVQDFLKLKSVDRALAASGYKPGDVPEPVKAQIRQFAQELTTMPTEYFEAKPQRAVGLHEFRGAAVPHDASPETLDVLRQHGLRVEPYKRGDEEDRKRAIQKLAQEHDLMLSEGLSKAEGTEGAPRYDAISNLMRHPDPAERAMALKMAGVGRRHLAQALLSGDPALVAAALAHPSLDEETIGALAGSSGKWAEKRTLLARPDLTGRHLEQMVRSALR